MLFYADYDDDADAAPYLRTRHKKSQSAYKPKRSRAEIAAELGDFDESVVQGFNPQVTFSKHEAAWTRDALKSFYDENQIVDVLRTVKGGKEASVYCCQAHPASGVELMAAKIYRPRMFRSLKNDAMYREGRTILDEAGKLVRGKREGRAVQKRTRVGAQILITSWIEHEYQTLQALYAAGADVPRPFAQHGNAILMAYLGDEGRPAPALQEVTLDEHEVQPLFERVMANVEIMLRQHRVHADLSAFNILYWEGAITLIDFPQAVDAMYNVHAPDLLLRDVERVCQYFGRYGLQADAAALASDLWSRYLEARL